MMNQVFKKVSWPLAWMCVCAIGAAPPSLGQTPSLEAARPILNDSEIPLTQGANTAPADIGAIVALRAADKVTGRTEDILVETGVMQRFGQLEIKAMSCTKAPPEELPESTAFLQIDEVTSEGERGRIFSGWMFASTPALNALEHPVYDLWVTNCIISDGVDESESR